MTKQQRTMITDKKHLFKDFYIKWDPAIEERFVTEMAAKPDKDPQYILDSICRPYIDRKLTWTDKDALKVHKANNRKETHHDRH